MMKKGYLTAIAFSAVLLFSAAPSSAAPVDFINNTYYTTDTISGLDWLDVTVTASYSYTYVSSQLGVGGQFEGWRYATGEEFNIMVNNYTDGTNPINNYAVVDQEVDKIDGLISLLGDTEEWACESYFGVGCTPGLGDVRETRGMLSDSGSAGKRWVARLYSDDLDLICGYPICYPEVTVNPTDASAAHWFERGEGEVDLAGYHNIGSFLVRESAGASPVPIPPAAFMFAPALLGLLGLRRKLSA